MTQGENSNEKCSLSVSHLSLFGIYVCYLVASVFSCREQKQQQQNSLPVSVLRIKKVFFLDLTTTA